jgi:putative polyhydroxyalkanoate system protein
LTLINCTVDWHRADATGMMADCSRMTAEKGNQMADIQIVQEHNLSPERARAAAQQVADKVAAEFGMQWRWEGDVLRFERSGVEGALTLGEQRAALQIRLGMLMSAFRPMIEAKVTDKMRRVFATA